MELSEAIKAGAKLRPQGFRRLFSAHPTGASSCAVGAAVEAAGLIVSAELWAHAGLDEEDRELTPRLEAAMPLLVEPIDPEDIPCPASCPYPHRARNPRVRHAIAHLNDTHRWTREQIAAWVKRLEK